jgi:hypothetical protein
MSHPSTPPPGSPTPTCPDLDAHAGERAPWQQLHVRCGDVILSSQLPIAKARQILSQAIHRLCQMQGVHELALLQDLP